MARDAKRNLPTDPRVRDYENANYARDPYRAVDLDSAIVGVIPGASGLARYVYDLELIQRAYADSYGIDPDADEPGDAIHKGSGKTRQEILSEIDELVFRHAWEIPDEGDGPILVADPRDGNPHVECDGEDPVVLTFKGRDYWLVI